MRAVVRIVLFLCTPFVGGPYAAVPDATVTISVFDQFGGSEDANQRVLQCVGENGTDVSGNFVRLVGKQIPFGIYRVALVGDRTPWRRLYVRRSQETAIFVVNAIVPDRMEPRMITARIPLPNRSEKIFGRLVALYGTYSDTTGFSSDGSATFFNPDPGRYLFIVFSARRVYSVQSALVQIGGKDELVIIPH